MEKEFEALERLIAVSDESKYWNRDDYVADVNIVKQALTELKAIKEVKPSEALECLENLCDEFPKLKKDYKIISHALLKTQEQEKVLEVLFKKYVNVDFLTDVDDVIQYNKFITWSAFKLTQEEFNLLKRWCEKCQK